jgi:chemotaxis protein methyltransferase CheR
MCEAKRTTDDVEIDLILEGVYRRYGFDFRGYARSSIRRRIANAMFAEHVNTVSALQEKVLHDPAAFERLLLGLSVNVSAMFRDPGFFQAFRRLVVPLLRTYPFIRIWQAGCSTGEEVYSLAILLEEAGLRERCRIYATDINEEVLGRAKAAIYPLDLMQKYTNNYIQAGGERSFSQYYTALYDHAIFRSSLKDHVVFSPHNLVTDGTFNEFNAILCRNVMIYFGKPLQARVHELLYSSLVPFGVLAIGSKETLRFTPREASYTPIDAGEKIFRKVT